ncbi:MAG: hypothetical protein ACKO57_00880, partial [Alphaproteobacteria bacterium]
ILFSEQTWAEPNNPHLSPPELVPASDRDPEHLSMFVTHFFRWWVDNNVRASETQGNTKDHTAALREREETLKTILMPSLWDRYQAYARHQGPAEELHPILPVFPIDTFETTWRETAYAKLEFVNEQSAQLIVSLPSINIIAPFPEHIFGKYSVYRDRSSLCLVTLAPYQGTWRVTTIEHTNP